MASDDDVAMPAATDESTNMPTTGDSEVATPVAPKISEDEMSIDEDEMPTDQDSESRGPSVSSARNTGANIQRYVEKPPTKEFAKVQGFAKLKELLNDPDDEIAENIRATHGFSPNLASNNQCKRVRDFLTRDETQIDDKTIPYILATYCMIGGHIATMWNERGEGKKAGSKRSHTAWGKKVMQELQRLGTADAKHGFEIFKDYATANDWRLSFDYNEAKEAFEDFSKSRKAEMASNHTKRSGPLGKHGASSPRQSPVVKQQKTTAMQASQKSGSYHVDDDGTEEEGFRGDVDNDASYSGKSKDTPASKSPFSRVNFNNKGFSRPQVPSNGNRDQDLAPSSHRQRPTPLGPHHNHGPEDNFGCEGVPRRYGPGLTTSYTSSTQKLVGRTSQGYKAGYVVEKSTAPGAAADALSRPCGDSSASTGQHLFGTPSTIQPGPAAQFGASPWSCRGSTLSPGQTPFGMPTSVKGGYGAPHNQSSSNLERPSVLGNPTMGTPQFGEIDLALLSSSSQQDSLTRLGQSTPKIASLGRDEGFGTSKKVLSFLPSRPTTTRGEPDRLIGAGSDHDQSDTPLHQALLEDLDQDNPDNIGLSACFSELIGQLEASTKSVKGLYRDFMKRYERNINFEITRLKRELDASHQREKVKDDKIAAFEADMEALRTLRGDMKQLNSRIEELQEISNKSQRRTDLINRTSVSTILQRALDRAGPTGKDLGTISLAELLDAMDSVDGTSASGAEGS